MPTPGGKLTTCSRILVVEDNERLAELLQRGLDLRGFRVDVATAGARGEALALSGDYDLILLDVMLPDRDGISLVRGLRRQGISCYVVLLTALSATDVKVAGLEAGADDYLVKPFEFEELVARIRALLRRGVASEATRLVYGDLELDLVRRRARRAGRPLELRARELALLELLLRHPERVIDNATIVDAVWDRGEAPTSNAVYKCVSSLRRRVDGGFDRPLIHTVPGAGYRLALD